MREVNDQARETVFKLGFYVDGDFNTGAPMLVDICQFNMIMQIRRNSQQVDFNIEKEVGDCLGDMDAITVYF